MREETSKICFIICPIDEENTSIRKRADDLLEFIITPCLTKYQYEPIRADHISKPGLISNQVIRKVIDSDLVIADLFEFNPNVLYELAIRHVTRKPYIQLMEQGKKLPFDIVDVRTIFFDIKDIRSVNNAQIELEKQIKSIIQENLTEVESPISRVQDIKELLESRDPQKHNTAVILEQLSALQSTVNEINRELYEKRSVSTIQRYIPTISGFNIPELIPIDEEIEKLRDRTEEIEKFYNELRDRTTSVRKRKELEKKREDKDNTG